MYYHGDAGGNVTALLDGNQNLVGRYVYDPYGNLIGSAGGKADANVYRFSSKEYDARAGLYYYGFRFYEPKQRWLSRDPIGEWGGVNLYGFVDNSPVTHLDALGERLLPEGLFCLVAGGALAWAVWQAVELPYEAEEVMYESALRARQPYRPPAWEPPHDEGPLLLIPPTSVEYTDPRGISILILIAVIGPVTAISHQAPAANYAMNFRSDALRRLRRNDKYIGTRRRLCACRLTPSTMGALDRILHRNQLVIVLSPINQEVCANAFFSQLVHGPRSRFPTKRRRSRPTATHMSCPAV